MDDVIAGVFTLIVMQVGLRLVSSWKSADGSSKVLGAEFVYAEYRPDGSYSLHAINPILEPFKIGEYNPI